MCTNEDVFTNSSTIMNNQTYTAPTNETPENYEVADSYAQKLTQRKKKLTMNLVEF